MKLINQLKFLSIIFFTNLFLFSYPFVKSSFAQNKSPFEGLYIEGQVNNTQVQDIDLKHFTGTKKGRFFQNLKAKLGYDSDIGYGVEVGVSEFLNKNFRLGLSYGENKIELKKATEISNTDGEALPPSATPKQVRDLGFNFDSNVKIYSLNAYYDFNNFNSFVPFVGVGLGQADILNAKDKETSKSLYLGARYLVDKNIYVGGKGTYSIINGPEDKDGIKYGDISLYAVTLSVGYQF